MPHTITSVEAGHEVLQTLMAVVICRHWWRLLFADTDGGCYLQTLMAVVICTGAVFVLIFHVGVKEHKEDELECDATLTLSVRTRMSAWSWFKAPQFYVVSAASVLCGERWVLSAAYTLTVVSAVWRCFYSHVASGLPLLFLSEYWSEIK